MKLGEPGCSGAFRGHTGCLRALRGWCGSLRQLTPGRPALRSPLGPRSPDAGPAQLPEHAHTAGSSQHAPRGMCYL